MTASKKTFESDTPHVETPRIDNLPKKSFQDLLIYHLSARSVADCGILGHEVNGKLQRFGRAARNLINCYELPSGIIVDDFMDSLSKVDKYVEEHKIASFTEANGNPEKQAYFFEQYRTLDPRISKLRNEEQDLWRIKIPFEYAPIKVDVDDILRVQKFLNRDVKEYVFDIALIFPKTISVDYRGRPLQRSPYADFQFLELEGIIDIIGDIEEPVRMLNKSVNQP